MDFTWLLLQILTSYGSQFFCFVSFEKVKSIVKGCIVSWCDFFIWAIYEAFEEGIYKLDGNNFSETIGLEWIHEPLLNSEMKTLRNSSLRVLSFENLLNFAKNLESTLFGTSFPWILSRNLRSYCFEALSFLYWRYNERLVWVLELLSLLQLIVNRPISRRSSGKFRSTLKIQLYAVIPQ